MWKELGEALGDLAGTHVGERVNMVSAAWSTKVGREGFKTLDGTE